MTDGTRGPCHSPCARVRAFINDFHAQWSECAEAFGDEVDFERWRAAVAAVDTRHFVEGRGCGGEHQFSYDNAAHSPQDEVITLERIEGDGAVVETEISMWLTEYYEYRLERVEGDWRIVGLSHFLDAAGAPLVPESEREAILQAARDEGLLRKLPHGEAPNGDALFTDGRAITRNGSSTTLRVRALGTLRTHSGILGVRDLGDDARGLQPLARRVSPGAYPVDAVVAYDRVAALRVRLHPEAEVVSWHPADFASGGHLVGVDAGNVAIFDVASFVELEARKKTRFFESYVARTTTYPNAQVVTLMTRDDCVISESGWGDGAYPCYWGVDAAGRLVTLLVDFLVVAEFLESTTQIPWSLEMDGHPLSDPVLDEADVEVVLSRGLPGKARLEVRGSDFKRLRILDARGEELMNTDGLGLSMSGSRRRYEWPQALEPSANLKIEVTLHTGYRN